MIPNSQLHLEKQSEEQAVTNASEATQLTKPEASDQINEIAAHTIEPPRGQRSKTTNSIERQNKGPLSSNEEKKTREEKERDLMKAILMHMHRQGYPGRDKLANVIGVSAKTIDRYLDEMEKRGLIQKTGRSSFTVSEFAAKAADEMEKRNEKSGKVDIS